MLSKFIILILALISIASARPAPASAIDPTLLTANRASQCANVCKVDKKIAEIGCDTNSCDLQECTITARVPGGTVRVSGWKCGPGPKPSPSPKPFPSGKKKRCCYRVYNKCFDEGGADSGRKTVCFGIGEVMADTCNKYFIVNPACKLKYIQGKECTFRDPCDNDNEITGQSRKTIIDKCGRTFMVLSTCELELVSS